MTEDDIDVDFLVISHTYQDGSNIQCFYSIFYFGCWEVSLQKITIVMIVIDFMSLLSFSALLVAIGVYAVLDKWASGEGFR